jgi:hypothetical protein
VQRFLGRAAVGVAATFTVTYAGADGTRTTLTQRPPQRRVDVVAADTTESVLRLRDGTYACKQDTGRGWECNRRTDPEAGGADPDLGVFAPTNLDETVESLAAARSSYRFSVVDRGLAGTKATCLVTTPIAGGDADELCIAPTGAILHIRTKQRSLDATRYRPTANPAAFRLPAPAR